MRRERIGHRLQATVVVNEAWMRLAKLRNLDPNDRGHYLAAATTIPRFLVENARQKRTRNCGGEYSRISLQVADADVAKAGEWEVLNLIALDDALSRLSELNERAGRVVELRPSSDLTLKEVADELRMSERAVYGDWKFARAWLLKQLD